MAVSPKELQRLASFLALAESGSNPHDGERLAALAAAERMLAVHGLALRDLQPPHRIEQPKPQPTPQPAPEAWRVTVFLLLEKFRLLSEWEREFLVSLSQRTSLSEKQRLCLARMARKYGVEWHDD